MRQPPHRAKAPGSTAGRRRRCSVAWMGEARLAASPPCRAAGQSPSTVTATRMIDSVEVMATVMAARPSSVPRLRCSPMSLWLRDRRQMKKRLMGSSRPLTTWTPTSRLMTGMPGMTATTVAIDDHGGDEADEDGRLAGRCGRGPSRSRATPRRRSWWRWAGSRRRAGWRRAGRCRTAPRRTDRRTARGPWRRRRRWSMEWMPCVVERGGGGDDDEGGDDVGEDRPGDRLALLVRELVLARAALDGRRLQVELHVGGDGRAGGGDDEQ